MDNLKIPLYFKGSKIDLLPLEKEDMPLVLRWINNEEINFYNGARLPVSLLEQSAWYAKTAGDKTKKKLLVCLKTGEKTGMASLFNIDHRNQNAEIGIYIDPAYQGKGYAKEAIGLLVNFAFSELNMYKVYASIVDFNENSIKLFESAGFTREHVNKQTRYTAGKFSDVHVLSIFRKK